MDIFKGIGDFFGGLFGQKKKREDEQQPQQQQSAVSFNSTPKLGDNFANNLSNPTQPQQPKEFAKSSVDLNPVKPVQPVQSQPQMNREQERQQLANKYRQEETDRYNQGSDHAANFLNDIFSGGKTAQMRENTISQNIQNRVNAEILRKYGPDDQQVKQNIDQTSQNINKNASAVSDFTKNYNNNLQQTISAPVSVVKGAANSVVETMPKVSGAITELGANTIKLFDEDNQFANNLINRVRADREKNIVRKTLNDATGLTDQDNKLAYGLGSSGARMAIDAAMTPVTGGLAPALVHGVEAHSDMIDHLDNIEARKKAEAAAKGETYTPSSFGARYLASTANAGAQAAIEKLGIDNLTGKIGGKFAKNMVGRAITGALGEAGEEASQQYAENFTKKLFNNKQDIHEGVAESALMGGIMGGAGKMAFGGMESVKNPYNTNNGKFNSYDPKSLIEAERNAVRTGLFNKNNANSDLSLADTEFNVGAPERLAKALRNGADGDVSFMRMPNRLLGEVNTIRQNIGQNPLKTNEITAYKNAVNNHLNKRVLEGMSPETVAHIAADSFINPYSKALPVDNNGAYDRNHIQMAVGGNPDGKYNTTTFSQFGDNISLKNITPRKSAEIKNLLQRREEILNSSSDGGASVVPSSTDVGGAPFSAGRTTYTDSISQNIQKVNNGYDPKALYEAERNTVTPTREKITLAEAERQNRGGDLQYTPRRETNISRLDSDQLGFTKDELIGKFTGDTRKRMSERSFNILQDLRANNPYMTGDGQEAYLSARGNKKLSSTSATIDDATFKARMRTTPRFEEILRNSTKTHSADDLKQHGIAPDGFDYLSSPVNVNGKRYMQEFDIGKNNETGRNTVYNSKLKEEPELSGFYTRSNSGSYGSNIAQNDQKVNAFNRKYEPEIQDLQNAYQKYGDDFEFNLTPEQQAPYEHLLRESPRDSEGRYIDPATGEVTIDQIVDRPDGSRYVEIDNNIINGLQRKIDIQKAVKNYISENFQGNQYQIGDTGEYAKVTKKTKNEIAHQQKIMSDIDYEIKARMSGNLDELINTMQDVRRVENKKTSKKPNVDYYLSGRTEVVVDGEAFYPRVDIEVGKNGNVVAYDIADIKKEPRSEQYNRSYIRKANSVLDNQGLCLWFQYTTKKPKSQQNATIRVNRTHTSSKWR